MTTPEFFRPVHVWRWANLRAAFDARGWDQKAACEALERSQAQVSHVAGRKPSRPIGDELAAALEGQLDLPAGALDQPLDKDGVNESPGSAKNLRSASQFEKLPDEVLAEADKWVSFEEASLGRYQPVRRARRLLAILELLLADGGRLSPAHAAELIDQVREQGADNARPDTQTRGRS